MTAVAPPHEKVVVVVTSQEHPFVKAASSGAARFCVPQITQFLLFAGKRLGVFPRVLCGRVPQRAYCDGYRIDEGAFSGTLGARVELAGDIHHIIADQLADLIAVLLFIGAGRHV